MKRSAGADERDWRGADRAPEAPDAKRRRRDGDGAGADAWRPSQRPSEQQRQQSRPAGGGGGVRLLSDAKEEDPHRLAQRQKQIDYGKNTVGYDRYCAAVPRHQRRRGVHPMTPDKSLNVSKKAFDGLVRKWRQALHKFDPPELRAADAQAREQAAAAAAAAAAGAAGAAAPDGGAATSAASTHEDDVAELDPARNSSDAAAPPALSIYENFVEGDLDNDGGDDDDDLL